MRCSKPGPDVIRVSTMGALHFEQVGRSIVIIGITCGKWDSDMMPPRSGGSTILSVADKRRWRAVMEPAYSSGFRIAI